MYTLDIRPTDMNGEVATCTTMEGGELEAATKYTCHEIEAKKTSNALLIGGRDQDACAGARSDPGRHSLSC